MEKNGSPQSITQIPFESLLDKFSLFVTDFYPELNAKNKTICYQEFGSTKLENIKNLRSIIGKRVYAEPFKEEGEKYYILNIK